MRWAMHVARMEEIRGACRVVLEKHEGRRPLGRTKLVDGRIILKQIFSKLVGSAWNGLIWPRIGGKWRSLVKTLMNLRVSIRCVEYLD